ncbi:unnamed protein product, partial [Mesorhabditis spiculigera]
MPPPLLNGIRYVSRLPPHLHFERATVADLPVLCDVFLNQFVRVEPHAKALRMGKEAVPLFEAIAAACVRQPFALKLIDNQQDNRVVGFRLLGIGHRDPSLDPYPIQPQITAPNVLTFIELMEHTKKLWLDALPDVNKVLRREISFISPGYQRLGLGAHMLHHQLDFDKLKADGVQGIVSEATSKANQHLLSSRGYKKVAQLPDSVYKQLFIHLHDGTRNIEAFFYDLR